MAVLKRGIPCKMYQRAQLRCRNFQRSNLTESISGIREADSGAGETIRRWVTELRQALGLAVAVDAAAVSDSFRRFCRSAVEWCAIRRASGKCSRGARAVRAIPFRAGRHWSQEILKLGTST